MKIIYVSTLCSKSKFKSIFEKSKQIPGQAVQKYHRLLTEGLAKNEGIIVEAITSLPITRQNSDKIYIRKDKEKENNVNYNYLTVINIPIIKNIYIFIESLFKTLTLCKREKEIVIICDILNISVSMGALLAAKLLRKNNIGIVTDIPMYLTKNNNKLSTIVSKYLMNQFSSYVFLTDEMNNVVNCKNKPYIVIEGHVDYNMKYSENKLNEKLEKKICIYAGGIHKIYGIKNLTEAFIKSNIHNSELHIYGDGDFKDELIEICKKYDNIKYFGVVLNEEVVKAQLEATLLINPRPTNEEYTKYSFPSKNMEYMVSGTPVLTTKLPGMPKEYNDYVYLIEDETVDGLKDTLINILNNSKEELFDKGRIAKQFVLDNKNNIIQSKKIISMVGDIK